ncbi:thiosulfate sulfurtransferase GlpE [Halopseudomonas nanhaiensis]|uniref:thiosulfate sulfurtransferase GlpE n=1 Tax=Halopseudomonas nanhaiensis TaxID=2830842 RepID=UPI001CBD5072|nr:thiosulfate sulfurtransferase GlpE [Halopseudomonas nanhaiensis]UAW98766.1 thiosulfate sulfurtransferase GlpE [Halopseudomonas nanhaiensis]
MSDFKRIDPDTAAALMQRGATVVDIRDPQSFDAGHIVTARRLDNDSLPGFVASAERQTPLVVCCYHGNSSQPAAAYLASLGFAEVYSLDGGFELWRQAYPTQISRNDS